MQTALSPYLFDATGGLRWHARALASRHGAWAPFRAGLADWLETWRPRSRRLLLLGPSAGWCLPDAFLARFDAVHGVDLDLLSQPLFRLAHPRSPPATWSHVDLFANLAALLEGARGHAVLLCNVAGQRRLHAGVAQAEADIARLRDALAGRDWASFHDLLSGACADDLTPLQAQRRMGGAQVLAHYRQGGEWLDHLTGALLPPHAPRRILPWRITGARLHFVEAGFISREGY